MSSLLTDPDNGGAFGAALRWAFGRSWRTTIAAWGALAATLISAVAAMSDAPHPIVKWAPIVGQFLMAAGLMITKDARVTGLDRPPPASPPPPGPMLVPDAAPPKDP